MNIGAAGGQAFDRVDDILQGRPLSTQLLGPFGIFPDTGLGLFELFLGESILAIGKVKDTP